MKKFTRHDSSSTATLSSDQLAQASGGAMDFNKLFPTLNSAAAAVADLQSEADGGPYHPGGAPPDYGNLIK